MADVLHIAMPPRFERRPDGRVALATSVQDSPAHVADCVEIILRTREGQRALLPDFGRPDLEFEVDDETVASLLQDAVDRYEKRWRVIVDGEHDPDDPGVVRLFAALAPLDEDEL